MAEAQSNRFGRRGGRGVRPWILIPKILAVAIYFGGLTSATVVWFTSGFSQLPAGDPKRLWILSEVGHLMVYVAVPALLAAMGLGIALLLQHPREFLRMRWMIVKLASAAIVIPAGHLICRSRVDVLREAFARGVHDEAAARELGMGLMLAVVGSIWIIVLGRLKPRLGQNWAKSFSKTTQNYE